MRATVTWRRAVVVAAVGLFCAAGLRAQSFRDASDLITPGTGPDGVLIGASAVDVDNDGRVDLYRPGRLYLQQPDGAFRDERHDAGLEDQGDAVFGAVFGDYDNDGFLDMYVEDLQPPSLFFRNRRNGTFRQANDEANLDTRFALTQGSAWGDFNADGLLDLFVGSDDGNNLLFLNTAAYRFSNASFGLAFERNSYGVAAADYDRDGDLDVFIGTCHPAEPERSVKLLFRNDGTGRFAEVADRSGLADDLASWGTVWLDADNDGWQDLFVANMPAQDGRHGSNRLYWNDREGRFFDIAGAAGVAGDPEAITYGAAAADFDNDGWVDLVVADAARLPSLHLFRNQGRLAFAEVDLGPEFALAGTGVVAVADLNDDGWIDLYAPDFQREWLWLNEGGTNHWLKVKTRGTASNHFGVGARLDLYAGALHQVREITAGDGMTSQNHDLTAHFGLGTAPRVDSLVVRWPNGGVDRLRDVAADRAITVVEGHGINQPPARFRLVAPANGLEVSSAETALTFAWEASADPDGDALAYSFHLGGPDFDLARTGLAEPRLVLDAAHLPINQPLRWSVSATDGHSVRAGMDRFVLTRAGTVAAEALPEGPGASIDVVNYPNPFRAGTTLHLTLPQPARVEATVYDMTGRAVRVLVDGFMPGGPQQVVWDGRDARGRPVAPGLYVVRVEAGGLRRALPIARVR